MNCLKILSILSFIFTSNALFASTLRIEPIRLSIPVQETITTLKIMNDSHDAISVQIDPKLWTQKNNQDFYETTTDILVIPPIVTIGPAEKQIIRIAKRHNRVTAVEQQYRLFVQELNTITNASKKSNLKVVLNLRLPLFLLPEKILTNYHWEINDFDLNKKKITLTNNGNTHIAVSQFALKDKLGKSSFAPIKTLDYILPYKSKSWIVPNPLSKDRLSIDATVNVPQQ
ncbi:fimbria/pilus periplasmic chaperone [Candidatus Berkiella cookevillensis]|uniref:Fimbria/pilus periplasmic chaperone n=1 Tax=Candidatus Berkiella cookevillensis TaxID=437022 RepID=A0A0Q9YM47_9GAMM|nr:fimbria/pilus periplasmic chaperone [Candidatus Berkiella cookevillensis]MCS5707369.1 fimbria/pilus periplasmic chaperone [Candidatus Berkiella cookevillensis]